MSISFGMGDQHLCVCQIYGKFQQARQEIQELQEEHIRERQELEQTQEELTRELKLKYFAAVY